MLWAERVPWGGACAVGGACAAGGAYVPGGAAVLFLEARGVTGSPGEAQSDGTAPRVGAASAGGECFRCQLINTERSVVEQLTGPNVRVQRFKTLHSSTLNLFSRKQTSGPCGVLARQSQGRMLADGARGSHSLGVSKHTALAWPAEARGDTGSGHPVGERRAHGGGVCTQSVAGRGVSAGSLTCYLGDPCKLTGFSTPRDPSFVEWGSNVLSRRVTMTKRENVVCG